MKGVQFERSEKSHHNSPASLFDGQPLLYYSIVSRRDMSLLPRGYYISVVKRYKQKQTMRGIPSDELPVDWSLCATVAWSHIQEVSVPTPTQSRRGIQNSHPGRLPIKQMHLCSVRTSPFWWGWLLCSLSRLAFLD